MKTHLLIPTRVLLGAMIWLVAGSCLAQGKSEQNSSATPPLQLEAAKTDLDALHPGKYLAAKDSKGNIFLLDVDKQKVLEFSKAGKSRDVIPLRKTAEQSGKIDPMRFDVSPDGEYFGFASGEKLLVYEGEQFQKAIQFEDPPALIYSLAFIDSEPEIALTRTFVAPVQAFPSILESSHAIVTVDSEGRISPFALPIDLEKEDLFRASLKTMCNLQLDEDGRIWVAMKSRYLIRAFKASGKPELEITDKDVSAEIVEKEFEPENVGMGKDLSGDSQVSSSRSASMNTVIRAFEVADGRLWLIINADIPGKQRLDILDIDSGKVESIDLPEALPTISTIAVNDRLIVLGTANAEGRPNAFDLQLLERELEKREAQKVLERKEAEEKEALSP